MNNVTVDSAAAPPRAHARRPELDRHLTLLARRDGSVQVGCTPERTRLLSPPPGVEAAVMIRALKLIDGRRSVPDIYWRAAELGIDASHMTRILRELEDAALVRPRRDTDPGVRTLLVVGRGPLADAVSRGLAPGSSVERASSLPPSPREFDCAVLADQTIPDPSVVADLMLRLIPHIPVRLRDGCGVVGPLVLPGHTSCLRCADLLRCDYDREWPYLAAQLFGAIGTASATTAAATAALCVAQVDALLTRPLGPPPTTLGASIEVDVGRASLRHRPWPVHRLCGCTTRA